MTMVRVVEMLYPFAVRRKNEHEEKYRLMTSKRLEAACQVPTLAWADQPPVALGVRQEQTVREEGTARADQPPGHPASGKGFRLSWLFFGPHPPF